MRVIESNLKNALELLDKEYKESASGFPLNRKPISIGNTHIVTTSAHCYYVYLHGNMIAKVNIYKQTLYISNCGWFSNVTKSLLNVILSHYNLPEIKQVKGKWYIDGKEFKGNRGFTLKLTSHEHTQD